MPDAALGAGVRLAVGRQPPRQRGGQQRQRAPTAVSAIGTEVIGPSAASEAGRSWMPTPKMPRTIRAIAAVSPNRGGLPPQAAGRRGGVHGPGRLPGKRAAGQLAGDASCHPPARRSLSSPAATAGVPACYRGEDTPGARATAAPSSAIRSSPIGVPVPQLHTIASASSRRRPAEAGTRRRRRRDRGILPDRPGRASHRHLRPAAAARRAAHRPRDRHRRRRRDPLHAPDLPQGATPPFCHLRKDHLSALLAREVPVPGRDW